MDARSLEKCAAVLLAGLALATSCSRPAAGGWQGYLEGDFVYVAAPLAGQLAKLARAKGRPRRGRARRSSPWSRAPSFPRCAKPRSGCASRRPRWPDLRKGPAALRTGGARSPARSSPDRRRTFRARPGAGHQNCTRRRSSRTTTTITPRLNHEASIKLVAETAAQLATAQLGGRTDAITAAEGRGRRRPGRRSTAPAGAWRKKARPPRAPGLVYDTLYREGEFVPAAAPVVSLLPPENIKVRFFVPEAEFGALKAGDRVRVALNRTPGTRGAHQLPFTPARIHPAGALQSRKPEQTCLHGRGGFRPGRRA